MRRGSGFELPEEPAPKYGLLDFDCYRCSKPRWYVDWEYPHNRLKMDCPINSYAPFCGSCEHYSRDPGVD